MKLKKYYKILLSISLVAIFSIAFNPLDDDYDFEVAKSFDLFHDIVREVRLYYVDDVDVAKLIGEASKELLKKLDPYTVFYSESEAEDFRLMTTGAYGGIGASIIKQDNALIISNIRNDSPAQISGLKIGDKIISVNGIKITKDNISEILKNIKGEPGSKIEIGIKRFSENEILYKTIVRKKIMPEVIPYSTVIKEKVAYVKFNEFARGSAKKLKTKLKELTENNKANKIILDLRSNPGGLLNEAVEIVNMFVPKGTEIVSTKGKVESWNHVYKALFEPEFADLPVTVLINNRSASASEIVAGALQDLDRGIILGTRSFGKGLVQVTQKLEYNTRIKITTAKYYIPSGRCIQALDYSHRNPDGSAGKVPDSLISEFKTANGRKVYDGGGIYPDIFVKPDTLNKFTKDLIENFEIFNFATRYFYKHKQISEPETFSLNDIDYNDFINFVLKSDTEFKSETRKKTEDLLKTAKKEHYDASVINEIKILQKRLSIDKKRALTQFKKEIKPVIEKEIIKRYYGTQGIFKRNINKDKIIKEALNVLQNKNEYQKILSGVNR